MNINGEYNCYQRFEVKVRALEKQLHERFANKRLDGEWFALTDQDIEELRLEFNG